MLAPFVVALCLSWTTQRARVAALARYRKPNDPNLIAARDVLRSERMADVVRRAVDQTALNAEDRARLVRIIEGAPDA